MMPALLMRCGSWAPPTLAGTKGRGLFALVSLVLVGPMAGCEGSGPTDPPREDGARTVKGIALSPRGFPESFAEILDFLDEAGSFSDAGVLWNGAWRDDVEEGTDAGTPPGAALLTLQQAAGHGYEPILVVGWRGNEGPHIRIPSNPDNSWANEEAAALYVEVVAGVADTYRPPFLFLGNESSVYFSTDPEDYARWIAVYNDAYDAIKSASPETLVGPIFQYERTAGIGVLAGMNQSEWGAVTMHDFDRIDVLGLTVYPFFAHATPNAVPATYLDPLLPYIGDTPIAITETGWPAEIAEGFVAPWEASEAHQVTYLERLGDALEGWETRLVSWLFLHPPVAPEPGGLAPLDWNIFHSLSLRRASGEERPVYDVWEAFTPEAP